MGRKRKGKAPCFKCEKQGCGAYHDICDDYQNWLHNEIPMENHCTRYYIPDKTWKSRGNLTSKLKQSN